MRDARLSVIVLASAAASFGAAVDDAAARKFHYSHRVTISGRLVDHWTVNDTRTCGPVGDGTVTVELHQRSPAKALVEYNAVEARWLALVPVSGGLLGGLPPKPMVGTMSLVDNTVATAPPGVDCSGAVDKSGCGTLPLRGDAGLTGDRRGFKVAMDSEGFDPKHGACGVGELDSFIQPPGVVGGDDEARIPVKLPSPRSFKRRHTVTVTGTTHRASSFGGSDPDDPRHTDDVTRTVTITFTRLS